MPEPSEALEHLATAREWELAAERRRMEQEIVAGETRYRALFDEVPVGLWQTTPDGRILAGNRTFLEMLGVRELADLEGWNVAEGYLDPGEREAWCRDMERLGYVRRVAQWRCPDGRVLWVDERARLCREPGGGVHYDGSALDITEHKLAEAAAENLRERLRQSEKLEAVGQLAGGVAHDFNNQLCAIMAFAESLEEMAPSAQQKQFAGNILRACQRSAELIRNLLAFARRGHFMSEPLDLHPLILEMVGLLSHTLDKRITLRTRLEAEGSLVEGDPAQLQNALMNLALNARDAMPEGGTLTFATAVRTLAESDCLAMPYEIVPGTYLEVCVDDTGTGMDPETLRHIFEPFYTTKGLGKGTGLGLASVYGTVNQHRGHVQAFTSLGRGSSFRLYLPLAGSCPAQAPEPGQAGQAGSGRILFVDDESLVADSARSYLESLHYRVQVCRDGLECVESFAGDPRSVDLVVLDMAMPRLGGRDTFLALRRIDPAARVLLVSGFSAEDEARALLRAGAVGYLQKPYRRFELANAVARALRLETAPRGTPS